MKMKRAYSRPSSRAVGLTLRGGALLAEDVININSNVPEVSGGSVNAKGGADFYDDEEEGEPMHKESLWED